MYPIIGVLHAVLLKIGEALFNVTFIFVTFILYMLLQSNKKMALTSLTPYSYDMVSQVFKVTVQGILAGIIGSIVIVGLGLPIRMTPYFALLLPIAIVLSFYNLRYLCFSYSAGLLGLMSVGVKLLEWNGISTFTMDLNPSGLIALVGVLHLMEAILIKVSGGQDSIPIMVRKKGQIGVGYVIQKFWPMPIALLILSAMLPTESISHAIHMPKWWPMLESIEFDQGFMYGFMPLTAILGYGNVAVASLPEKRSNVTATRIFIYSLLLIFIALISINSLAVQVLGLVVMPVVHELLIVVDQRREMKKDILITVPDKGVRVVKALHGGHGEKMGMQTGDRIISINNIKVINYRQMRAILREFYTFVWVKVERIDGSIETLEHASFPYGIESFDIVHVPEKAGITYEVKTLFKTRSFLDPILKSEREGTQ